jgi:hypothetical protein
MIFSPKKGLVEIGLFLSGFHDQSKAYLELEGTLARRYGEGKKHDLIKSEKCAELRRRFYRGDKIEKFEVRHSHRITVYDIDQGEHSIKLTLDEVSTCPDFSTKMRNAWDPPDPSDVSFDLRVTYRADDDARNACDHGIAFPQ